MPKSGHRIVISTATPGPGIFARKIQVRNFRNMDTRGRFYYEHVIASCKNSFYDQFHLEALSLSQALNEWGILMMKAAIKKCACIYVAVLYLFSLASAQWIQYPANGFASMTHYTMPNDFVAACGCTPASR
jgi:hypothetical protein